MTIDMESFKPTPSPTAKECRELLKDLKPVKEWRKGYWWLCILYFLIMPGTLLFILAPLADYGIPSEEWAGFMWPTVCLLSLFLSMYLIGVELNLALYNNFDVFRKSINPLLEDGEEVLTMVRGRVFSFVMPQWLDPHISDDSYFFFTTDRLLIVCLYKGTAHKIPGGHLKTVAQMVKKTNFEGMIQDVYTVSLLEPKVKPVSFGWNILMLNHDKVTLTPVYQTEPYTWLWGSKGTRHGRLIKTILQRLERGSEGFRF